MATSKNGVFQDDVLDSLVQDPTRSVRDIAKGLQSYRQKVWRQKKKLEEEHIIWGYTAVVNERKLNHTLHLVFLKMKPLDEGLVSLMQERLKDSASQDVRILNVLLINGDYDWAVMFSAKDHATARRYYDSIRLAYDGWLLDKPMIVDVALSLIREGKKNPEPDRLYDFIPKNTLKHDKHALNPRGVADSDPNI